MEARFVVNRQYRKADSVVFARVTYGKNRAVYAIMTLLYWGLALYILQFGVDWFDAPFILFAILIALLTLFHPQFMAWRMRRMRNKRAKVTDVVLRFNDENIAVSSNLDEGTVKYDALMKIVETKGYYFLYVQKYTAYIVPKSDFTHGAPDEFAAFISEKTGLDVKRVKG